ncbi:hypothetical protein T492DRAFT_385257 [Pavlovales sp. CCMP2436]|nr:hypothetical protein T492DRAFT_385257 [Pavlovales sp. CCMP2436]|mmetsp:Transcript_25811/g.60551  ORF Transcript_25811/g.60551 Transcript_25811/m.60551 type:complete len:213 (+) Transcript_25811:1166-1804(+)
MSASLLADALAIACQALLASALSTAAPPALPPAGEGGRRPNASRAQRELYAGKGQGEGALAQVPAGPSPRLVVVRTARLSLALCVLLCSLLSLGRDLMLRSLAPDEALRAAAASVWPFVVFSQPATVAAFVVDGLLFGSRDFGGAALAMVAGAVPGLLLLRAPVILTVGASSAGGGLTGVWVGLVAFMAVRATVGLARALRPGSSVLARSST